MNWVNGVTKLSKATMEEFERDICDMIYPVGSYYWSSESTAPSTLFGGTWERVKDTFLYALGDSGSAGDTGGNSSVTLAEENLPNHKHTRHIGYDGTTFRVTNMQVKSGADSDFVLAIKTDVTGGTIVDVEKSGGQDTPTALNTMPPYIKAYCWRRTA